MSTGTESSVAATTAVETITSQASPDFQTSTIIETSSAAVTSASIPATTAFSEVPAPAASGSTAAPSFVKVSSFQSQPPVESQQIPSSSTSQIAQTTFAPPQQSSDASSSSTVQTQPSVESQAPVPSSAVVQQSPSSTLLPLPSTAISVSQIPSQLSSISSPLPLPSAVPVMQSSDPSSPLASPRLSQVSSPIQITSVSLQFHFPIQMKLLTINKSLLSTLSTVPQSISTSSISTRASSSATPLIAGSLQSHSDDFSDSHSTSAAVVVGASVASVLVVTAFIIAAIFLYRKRKAKRISKKFEASLGRTNILDEKGSTRSGKAELLGRARSSISGGTGGKLNPPTVNSPVSPAPVAVGNAWRPQRPPRPEMVPLQASSTFRRLLYDVQSNPF